MYTLKKKYRFEIEPLRERSSGSVGGYHTNNTSQIRKQLRLVLAAYFRRKVRVWFNLIALPDCVRLKNVSNGATEEFE